MAIAYFPHRYREDVRTDEEKDISVFDRVNDVSIILVCDETSVEVEGASVYRYLDYGAYLANDPVKSYSGGTIRIIFNQNQCCLKIKYFDQDNEELAFYGKLNLFDLEGYYKNRLLLGDFSGKSKDYHVILVRFDDGCDCKATVLLENLINGEILEFISDLVPDQYAKLTLHSHSVVSENVTEISELEGMIGLLEPQKQCLVENNLITSQSNYTFKNTDANSGTSVSYSNLTSFFNQLANNNSAVASGTVDTMLRQTGWKLYKNGSYFYIMYGIVNTSTERLVGISVVLTSNNLTSSLQEIAAQCTTKYSVTLSYNTSTNTANVIMSSSGIRLEDGIVAVELNGGSTNFINAHKTYVLEHNNGLKNILIAIADTLGVPSAIWNALTTQSSSSDYVDFGDDAYQQNEYDGLVRAAANGMNSGTYIWSPGYKLGITAHYSIASGKTYSGHRFAYKFKGYALI